MWKYENVVNVKIKNATSYFHLSHFHITTFITFFL
jgi:hypothetical protein